MAGAAVGGTVSIILKKQNYEYPSMKYFASCSFGKDSVATVLLAIENNEPLDGILFNEIVFDHKRNISGEIPEHIEWVYNTAIPTFERMGVPTKVIKSEKDYMYFFHKHRRGGSTKANSTVFRWVDAA